MNNTQRIETLEREMADIKNQLSEIRLTASRELESVISSISELRATDNFIREELTQISQSLKFPTHQ